MITWHGICAATVRLPRLVEPAALLTLGLASTLALANAPKCETEAAVTTLYSFGAFRGDGVMPQAAPFLASDGNLYGTTIVGGSEDVGTIYKVTPAGEETILLSFQGGIDGINGVAPTTSLIQGSDGALYGTSTVARGTEGTVFKITLAGAFAALNELFGNGCNANTLLQGSDGDFYGTTSASDCKSEGTVFKMTTAGQLSTLHSFSGSDGAYPGGALVQGADGNYYGTTILGGAGAGTFFRVSPSGIFTSLYSFTWANYEPFILIAGPNGSFYGASSSSVFQLTPYIVIVHEGDRYVQETYYAATTLHAFSTGYLTSLIMGSDGYLYGTADYDAGEYGTIFRMAPGGGSFSTLFTFDASTGSQPMGIIEGSDGNFYGTTSGVGDTSYPGSAGTVFAMTLACVPPSTGTKR
jgi:uncharacterized repeat protein (TIGR03803 family)